MARWLLLADKSNPWRQFMTENKVVARRRRSETLERLPLPGYRPILSVMAALNRHDEPS